jgi:hypothetical protein
LLSGVETRLEVGKLEYVDDQDQQEDLRDGFKAAAVHNEFN